MKYQLYCLCTFLILYLGIIGKTRAQEILTLEDAVRIALEKNYAIKLNANELEVSRINVNRANAGMLPAATGNLTNNNSIQNSRQTRSDGQVNQINNGRGNNLNYGIGVGWTVFDGFAMFARYEQLKELQKLGEANLRVAVLNTIGDVYTAYYTLVQQQQQLRALDTTMIISRLRVRTAQARFEIGKAARLEVLNAQVDFNTDTTNLIRQQEIHRTTQIQLNQIMARDVNITFRVIDNIAINNNLLLTELTEKALTQNPLVQAAIINKRVIELDLKQVKANRFPSIGLNTGYNFTQSQSALGFATQTTGRGFTYGLTASVNIFNGFLQRRNERVAALRIDNAQLQYEQLSQDIKAQLASAYQTYQTNLLLVTLEENNQSIAKQNLDITMEKYRLGTITTIEVREAQLNYVNAIVRFSNAQTQAKLAEVALREIAGNLNL